MISFENEVESSRDLIGARTDLLLARERREVFSLHPEIRFLAWAGAMLLAAAAATFIANNRERIGPLVIAIVIGLAAAACYGFAWWRRRSRDSSHIDDSSLVDDYVLLLGALLLSADVGFIESQFHLFEDSWTRHFLILALVHGITAYRFDSRMVLTLSIAALAAWFGIEERDLVFSSSGTAADLFAAAVAVLAWTLLDRRFRPSRTFDRTFEHFIANLALAGGVTLVFDPETIYGGVALTLLLVALVIAWGLRTEAEPFVLYAIVYGVIAVDSLVFDLVRDEPLRLLFAIVSVIAALVLLLLAHARFRRLA